MHVQNKIARSLPHVTQYCSQSLQYYPRQMTSKWFQKSEDITIPEQVNIAAVIFAIRKAKPSLNISPPTGSFAIYVNHTSTHINFKKRIIESYFKHDASKCLQLKYNWDKRTINNIEWDLYSSYYKPLSISKKAKYISLYTPHISSRKMMFEWKYCCPHCRLLPDSTTNHDHFLTYIDSWQQKQK